MKIGLIFLRKIFLKFQNLNLYDAEIAAICEQIDKVKAEIPNLPEWVNEDSLPDLSWVGRTFSVIDEDVTKVNDALHYS